jgi:transposase, IS30 family
LILGRASRSALGTLVDRSSRCLRLIWLPAGHGAEAFAAAAAAVLAELPPEARMTLTWDQGSEMARHDLLAGLLIDGVFFAHPASPWERATNENTVSLVVARLGWSGRLVPAACGDSREHWPPVGVPCV